MLKQLFALFAGIALSTAILAAPAANTNVEMQTSLGKVVIELYPEKAPKTVENFIKYVKEGFYEKTVFHRVIDGFMIQGGGFTEKMEQKPTRAPIANEAQEASKAGLHNTVGTLAMARTADPDSATAQFFVNLVDNVNLDYPRPDGYGYTVFGKVTEGMDVIQKIAKVATGNRSMYQNVPLSPVVIQSIKLVNDKASNKK